MNRFEELGVEIGKLVAAKNKAYGSAFQVSADLLKLFFPNGVPPEKYVDLLLIARICDKLMRVASKKEAFGESPFMDICGYGLLGLYADEISKDSAAKGSIDGKAVLGIDKDLGVHPYDFTETIKKWAATHPGKEISGVEDKKTIGSKAGNYSIREAKAAQTTKAESISNDGFSKTCSCNLCERWREQWRADNSKEQVLVVKSDTSNNYGYQLSIADKDHVSVGITEGVSGTYEGE